MKTNLTSIYSERFDKNSVQREQLWEILVKDYFQKFIKKSDTVLDLAAGYCEFINNVKCKEKIAVDLNKATSKKANKNVKVYNSLSTKLPAKLSGKVDVVFTSNFFEHLDNSEELMDTLKEVSRVLKAKGKIMILQPNIRLVGGKYWDYIDHTLPLTEKSLREALDISGYKVTFQKTRFLPYTANSVIPIVPLFVKIYLKMPLAQHFMGKQTFIIAQKI
jgi:ubiquinone/menaquinone biosynthesis C-methylase UbiE